jgi:hypothetical protein
VTTNRVVNDVPYCHCSARMDYARHVIAVATTTGYTIASEVYTCAKCHTFAAVPKTWTPNNGMK